MATRKRSFIIRAIKESNTPLPFEISSSELLSKTNSSADNDKKLLSKTNISAANSNANSSTANSKTNSSTVNSKTNISEANDSKASTCGLVVDIEKHIKNNSCLSSQGDSKPPSGSSVKSSSRRIPAGVEDDSKYMPAHYFYFLPDLYRHHARACRDFQSGGIKREMEMLPHNFRGIRSDKSRERSVYSSYRGQSQSREYDRFYTSRESRAKTEMPQHLRVGGSYGSYGNLYGQTCRGY